MMVYFLCDDDPKKGNRRVFDCMQLDNPVIGEIGTIVGQYYRLHPNITWSDEISYIVRTYYK